MQFGRVVCVCFDVVLVVYHVVLIVVIVVTCCCCVEVVHGKLLEVIRDGLGRLHLGCCCCLGCVIVVSIVVVVVVDIVVVWCDDFGYDSCVVCLYVVASSCKGALIDIRLDLDFYVGVSIGICNLCIVWLLVCLFVYLCVGVLV